MSGKHLVSGTTFQVLANSHTLSRQLSKTTLTNHWYMRHILNIAIMSTNILKFNAIVNLIQRQLFISLSTIPVKKI